MAKNISILGSTGSIGKQTLDVAKNLGLNVLGLSANTNIGTLEMQAREFKPKFVAVKDTKLAKDLELKLADTNTKVLGGEEGIIEIATINEVDTVVTAVVGISGLIPTIEAIKNKKHIALANKETLVTAGDIVMSEAKKNGVNILPVDSEHSAIFQCLEANDTKDIEKILLTASGGPFRGKSYSELSNVTLEQALKHPNWNMGNKITIDSSTLMNKGLEFIEAKWLFDIDIEKIQVIIHPQSIVHSMVEYIDGTVIAQLGSPDMRTPIQYALTYPERKGNSFTKLDLLTVGSLTFEEPDFKAFPCLRMAIDSLKEGGTMPVVLNAANEIAVGLFLDRKINYIDIHKIIENAMSTHKTIINPTLEEIVQTDRIIREMLVKN